MSLSIEIEELRNTIKHGEEHIRDNPEFWERVRSTLGKCGWYMEQAALFHSPEKFSIEQVKYDDSDSPFDQRYGPTHKIKIEVDVYEHDGLRDVLDWLFKIDYEMWG